MSPIRLAAIACLCVASLSAQAARLSNISTRGPVGTDASNMFGGFVIRGGPKTVLIRAVGPTLESFGVPGALAKPTVTIFNDQNIAVLSNGTRHGWGTHHPMTGWPRGDFSERAPFLARRISHQPGIASIGQNQPVTPQILPCHSGDARIH